LEQFESDEQQEVFRNRVRSQMATIDADRIRPLYLEAFLAARSFGDVYANRITDLAFVRGRASRPFSEVLLNAIENPDDAIPADGDDQLGGRGPVSF